MSGTFNPGDVVRFGKDNGMYIRAIDRSWLSVNIGYAGHPEPSASVSERTDSDVANSIARGYARVVYASEGHYSESDFLVWSAP